MIFISYSSSDAAFVRRLDSRLRTAGHATWLDSHEIVPGDSLSHRVATGLRDARAFVIVVSESSAVSNWVRYELNVAVARMVEEGFRVVPVVIGDVEIPSALRGIVFSDFRTSFEQGFAGLTAALSTDVSGLSHRSSNSNSSARTAIKLFTPTIVQVASAIVLAAAVIATVGGSLTTLSSKQAITHTYWTRGKSMPDGRIGQVYEHRFATLQQCNEQMAKEHDKRFILERLGCDDVKPTLNNLRSRCANHENIPCLMLRQMQ